MFGHTVGRRVHVSWMIAFTCLGVVCGVAIAPLFTISEFSHFSWLITAITLVLTAIVHSRAGIVVLAILGGCLVGLWRGSATFDELRMYEPLMGQTILVKGTVKEDIDKNKRGESVIRLSDIFIDEHRYAGSIWVTTKVRTDIKRSDTVTVKAKATDGFGAFALSLYDAAIIKIERESMGDVALVVRDWFADGVRRAISEPESSLGLGYLLGQRRGLPEDLDTALKAAGLTHIVVASGYNLTILVRFARRMFEKISKYLAFLVSGSMIVGFIAVTGLSPSMSRAGLVTGLSLIAWYYGRRFHLLVLLPFVMAITVLAQPSYAWGDLGWQLSFAAFAGVMIIAPLVQSYFFGDKAEKPLRRIFIETISAQIATLPILLLAFGQFSIVAPIANMMILPLVPLTMALTFIAGIAGLAIPAFSVIIGFPAELILTYMTATAQFIGALPWAIQDVSITAFVAILMYVGMITSCMYMWRKTKLALERTSLIE